MPGAPPAASPARDHMAAWPRFPAASRARGRSIARLEVIFNPQRGKRANGARRGPSRHP